MYVNSERSAYVKNRTLHIKPVLTEQVFDDLIASGNLYVAKMRAFINNTAQPWTYNNVRGRWRHSLVKWRASR
jgi:hypothetical protein